MGGYCGGSLIWHRSHICIPLVKKIMESTLEKTDSSVELVKLPVETKQGIQNCKYFVIIHPINYRGSSKFLKSKEVLFISSVCVVDVQFTLIFDLNSYISTNQR